MSHYLKICANHHKNDNYQKFTFIDLYCGEPYAHFENGDIENGSPLIALTQNVKCIFNDIDPNIYKEIVDLKDEYSKRILKIFNCDTNERINEIIKSVPAFFHSLFYIDPDNSSQLLWTTMEKIINHSYTYSNGSIRRPEILLNYPYYSISKICGFIDKNDTLCSINTKFYGNEEWIQAFKSGKTPEERRENLFNTYLKNYEPYYNHSYSVLVETLKGRPLYYIVFFSNYSKIDNILSALTRNINIWKQQDFIRLYKYNINYPIDYYFQNESKKIVKKTLQEINKDKKPNMTNFFKK